MYPIKPVRLPADLKGQKNGELDKSILKKISGGMLHHRAARAWNALVEAAKKDGITLKPTSIADAYRPLSVQERAFFSRYTTTARPGVTPRIYKGKKWYLKPGNAAAAVPGTSNHGWGLAVDVASIDQKKIEWLLKHADRYGFSWELQSEPWHLRYYAGDKIPLAVRRASAEKTEATGTPVPAPTAPVKKTAKKTVKKTGKRTPLRKK